MITNDPLIVSILAQNASNNPRPSISESTYLNNYNPIKIDSTIPGEKPKSSGLPAPLEYRSSIPYTQSTGPSREFSINPLSSLSYELSPPPKNSYTQQTSTNYQPLTYKSNLNVLPLKEFNVGYSQPMQLDNSPIVRKYT